MKLFFSGSVVRGHPKLEHCATLCKHRLLSCHVKYTRSLDEWMTLSLRGGNFDQEIMLDSGAFTAWSKGDNVNLRTLMRTYRSFLRKYESKIRAVWLINLDRIPGTKGAGEPSPDEIAAALVESDENFETLRAEFGDRVLPVFHQGESQARLRTVASQAAYICVSPRNDLPEGARVAWSRRVHDMLDASTTRTHGLATTGFAMATSVGWHSTDAATWAHAALYGEIIIGYGDTLRRVRISDTNPTRYTYNKHFLSMPAVKQQWLAERFASFGFTVEELQTDFHLRAAYSIQELIAWNAQKTVAQMHSPSLFGV